MISAKETFVFIISEVYFLKVIIDGKFLDVFQTPTQLPGRCFVRFPPSGSRRGPQAKFSKKSSH